MGTAKVLIRRIPRVAEILDENGKTVSVPDPITGFSYTPFRTPEMDSKAHSNGTKDFHPDPNQDTFEVSADIAAAAIGTGGFEVHPKSRVKLTGQPAAGEAASGEAKEGGE